MNKLREALFFVFLVGAVGVLVVGLYLLLELVGRKMQRRDACTKVLDCLDQGASREHCDALFPNCRKEAP